MSNFGKNLTEKKDEELENGINDHDPRFAQGSLKR